MADYVGKEQVIEWFRPYGHEDEGIPYYVLATDIREMKPADVVPVVRCKDCKYWQDNNDGYPHEECRWGHGETPDENDFCSYGERR